MTKRLGPVSVCCTCILGYLQRSYLPTMPQDNVDEVIQAMGIDHSKTLQDYDEGQEIPKLWRK